MMTLCTCPSFLLVAIATCVHTLDAFTVDGSDVKLDASCLSGNSFADFHRLVSSFYDGLFHTEEQIKKQEGQWRDDHKSKWGQRVRRNSFSWAENQFLEVNHDYDQCCPTVKYHDNKPTLKNQDGKTRTIMHLPTAVPPRFQWYPQAECGDPGNCYGQCRLEYISVQLLVYPQSGPLFPPEYDWFRIPGYCSCKSN